MMRHFMAVVVSSTFRKSLSNALLRALRLQWGIMEFPVDLQVRISQIQLFASTEMAPIGFDLHAFRKARSRSLTLPNFNFIF